MSEIRRCIYCWGEKNASEFSEEHIIPRFMGGTSECAAAITSDVCQRCNSLFGRFVDAPVAKGYFLNSVEHGAWRMCFNFDENAGNVYPLTYMGKSRDIQFGDDEETEVWLCPDGGTAWHVHRKQPEDFDAMAGGDPVLMRKDETSRVYSFLASEKPYWALSNLKSVLAHFTDEPIFLGTDSDLEPSFQQARKSGEYCQKDTPARVERDRILGLLDERRPLDHLIKMDMLFDIRFMAKIAIAFGFKILGHQFGALRYTEMLRGLLWTRRARLPDLQHQLRVKSYFAGLRDYTLKPVSFPLGFVFILKAFKEGLVCNIVFPSGHSVQASITDSTVNSGTEALVSKMKDHVLISVPQLKKTFGPIDAIEYVAWKTGSHRLAELDMVVASLSDRNTMPPLR